MDGASTESWLILWQSLPLPALIKWCALIALTLAVVAYLSWEQRKLHRYYQRLASHATSQDTAALEYALTLLALSSRNKLLFSLSFIIVTCSVILYDVKQRLNSHMEATAAQQHATPMPDAMDPSMAPAALPSFAANEETERLLDSIKREYEQAYVNFYILNRCHAADVDDLALMNSALLQALAPYPTPSGFALDVRGTAKSTYDELYKSTDCAGEAVAAIRQTHQAYLTQLRATLRQYYHIETTPVSEKSAH